MSLVNIFRRHPPFIRMCGKHRGYKSFVFVSVAGKGLAGDYFVCAANKEVRGKRLGALVKGRMLNMGSEGFRHRERRDRARKGGQLSASEHREW